MNQLITDDGRCHAYKKDDVTEAGASMPASCLQTDMFVKGWAAHKGNN